ncbi:hypothetical protein K501DRAFT_308324 [Backusella circina FSU 941]|nr:hypothetical protein K501DRAFT_308324 [Backusella circina FSU 941]
MNVNYFIRLSFHKLETFDINRTGLSTFVLVRNSLISALTEQKHHHDYAYNDEMDDIVLEEEEEHDDEQGKVWLDSCFDQLEQEDEDDSDEDMPLSPQQQQDDDFYSKPTYHHHQALIRYDLPLFLSLD